MSILVCIFQKIPHFNASKVPHLNYVLNISKLTKNTQIIAMYKHMQNI